MRHVSTSGAHGIGEGAMNRIGIVCTARPSWSKLLPVVTELVARGESPVLYMAGGALLFQFGEVVQQARALFPQLLVRETYSELAGINLVTAAKSTGGLLQSLADLFYQDQPRIVLVNHDRREVLAAAMAAAYQNIPVAHIGGGERSGNIDDAVRDAITALATYHFPATQMAAMRVYALTGQAERIVHVGCPSIDNARAILEAPYVSAQELGGVGTLNPLHPFLLVLQHAETEQPEAAYRQMATTLHAAQSTKLPVLVMWPGDDAGQEGAAKAIRVTVAEHPAYPFHTLRTLPPPRFLRLLLQAACLVGNSSAGIREASYLGVPTVNIGDRQRGRERGPNVVDCPHEFEAIRAAILERAYRPVPKTTLYGDGTAARRMVERLQCWAG